MPRRSITAQSKASPNVPGETAAAKGMTTEPWIAPSILAADFAQLGQEVADVVAAGADLIHFDVMDNHYVPNLSVGPGVLASLRTHGVGVPVDVHLMAAPVDRLIDDFLSAGADHISIHPEATDHPHRSLSRIREGGAKAGLALNPGTSLTVLEPLLDIVDLVLVMSVNPGFGGQTFIPSTLARVATVRQWIDNAGAATRLQIDGGIKADNIGAAAGAGADTFVAGSAIFGVPRGATTRSEDYRAVLSRMRAEIAATDAQP